MKRRSDEIEDLLWASEARSLSPLVQDTTERPRAFRAAMDAFAGQLGRKAPKDPIVDLSEPEFERALYLYMAALASLEDERIENAQEALDRTLNHERRFWRYQIDDLKLDGARSRILEKAVELAVATLTLVQGFAEEARARIFLREALESVNISADLFESLIILLRSLYGASTEKFLAPLQPDLMGEQLIAEQLSRNIALLHRLIEVAPRRGFFSSHHPGAYSPKETRSTKLARDCFPDAPRRPCRTSSTYDNNRR